MSKDKKESFFEKNQKKWEQKENEILAQDYMIKKIFFKKRFIIEIVGAVVALLFSIAVSILSFIFYPIITVILVVPAFLFGLYLSIKGIIRVKNILKKIEEEKLKSDNSK